MRRNLGAVSNKIFLIIFIIILAVGSLSVISWGIWRETGRNLCVIEQFSRLRSLEHVVERVKEMGGIDPEYKFKVMYCVDCIWYNATGSRLMIRMRDDVIPVPFPIETNFQGIGCNCNDCNQEGDINGDGQMEKCANLKSDNIYVFEIAENYVNLTGYVDTEGNVHVDGDNIPLSAKPCKNCVNYNEVCGDDGSGVVTCCSGAECKREPTNPLAEANWLGEVIGLSAESWAGEKCLKSLRQECTDYTECTISRGLLMSSMGSLFLAQYPCYTIGDDPTNRCCSPLLSKQSIGESSIEGPASYCTGYGGCNVYCGNTECGYVYNSTYVRFTDICCKSTGEECWHEGWQCCAHELYDKTIGKTPTQCLEDDGDPCVPGSAICHCCISPSYNCTFDTRNYCCFPNNCRDNLGGNCDVGDECTCV